NHTGRVGRRQRNRGPGWRSTHCNADSRGFLLSVIVGGLIWWILLVPVFGAIWRYRRRSVAAADKP
ncbi:MAG: hypothetical protein KKI02_07770, partial [Planctomycetes bacterium]|nr:hypothetical protein [Planctomycetota bacterium]